MRQGKRLTLRHVTTTKAGTWHYRRRLPKDAAEVLNKGEFKRRLGSTDREALRNYPKVNAEFERMVEGARRLVERSDQSLTPMEVHKEAELRARELALTAVTIAGRTVLAGEDDDAARILRDRYLSSLPEDPETGEPVGGDEVEGRALGILTSGVKLSRPAPTIEDAKRLYVQERITGDFNEKTKLARIDRMMEHLAGASITNTRTLESLTREDARNVRDHLLRDLGIKATTVRRYLNDIRAVINLGLTELGLKDAPNPFLNLTIRNETSAVNDRDTIPDDLLPLLRDRIKAHAGVDLWQIWRIIEHTGCRLGEVTGLMTSDLHLEGSFPHISLVPHPHRRLKNAGSARLVPLIGEALEAAQEALDAADGASILFARYGRLRGSDTASASLMKHVRTITKNSKIVVHSLRHRIEDKLTLADVSEFDRNLVLGHAKGSMSERYGSAQARLEVATRSLKAALGVAEQAPGGV
jgi:integrase